MARVAKVFMDRKDLLWFNDSVNDRIRCRLKYKGDFEITEAQADWDALAPTEIAHVYQLTSASEELKKITINDETYHVGDWVIVMNKTIKNDDGTIVDEDGNPAQVEVRKLGSSGMPDGEDDGDGIVFVNGEWALQKDYGYYKPNLDGIHLDAVEILPSGDGFVGHVKFLPGVSYTVKVNDVELGTFEVSPDDEDWLPFGDSGVDGWNGIKVLWQNGNAFLYGPHHTGETVKVDVEGELGGEYIKFDRRYIPGILPETSMPGDAMIYDGADWVPQDNYGFSVHNDDGEVFTTRAEFRQAGLGRTSADVKLGKLIDGETYTITINEDAYTATAVTADDYVVLEFTDNPSKLRMITDMGNKVVFDAGMDYVNRVCDITVTGFMGERVYKIDPKYLPEGTIPDGEDNGDANVWVDGEWKIQPSYGYTTEGEVDFSQTVTVNGGYSAEFVDMPELLVGEDYEVAVDGDDYGTVQCLQLSPTTRILAFGALNKPLTTITYNSDTRRCSAAFRVSADVVDTDHVISIKGVKGPDFHTFDSRYIDDERMLPKTSAVSDGLVYTLNGWKRQNGYGWVDAPTYFDADIEYTTAGTLIPGFPGLTEGLHSVVIGTTETNVTVTRNADGAIVLETADYIIRGEGDKWYGIAKTTEGTVRTFISGGFWGDTHEFNRRYIPVPTRVVDTQGDLPTYPDMTYRTGDLFFVNEDTTNVELARYALTDDAVAAGWTVDANGIVNADEKHAYTWEQLSANDGLAELAAKDDGDIYRAVLLDGTVSYGAWVDGMTVSDFASRTMSMYNREENEFSVIKSDVEKCDICTSIEKGYISDLVDNIFDEV